MKDVFHTLMRQQRHALAISEDDIATILSMSDAELYDLEAYPDEWRTVVPLFKIKVLAGLLKIDMRQVVSPTTNTLELQSLDAFIRARRTQLGLSPAEFADKTGFYPVFCDIVEGHALGLELWPAEVAVLVADALQISSEEFVDWIVRH
jgi:hypothetical protein